MRAGSGLFPEIEVMMPWSSLFVLLDHCLSGGSKVLRQREETGDDRKESSKDVVWVRDECSYGLIRVQ